MKTGGWGAPSGSSRRPRRRTSRLCARRTRASVRRRQSRRTSRQVRVLVDWKQMKVVVIAVKDVFQNGDHVTVIACFLMCHCSRFTVFAMSHLHVPHMQTCYILERSKIRQCRHVKFREKIPIWFIWSCSKLQCPLM